MLNCTVLASIVATAPSKQLVNYWKLLRTFALAGYRVFWNYSPRQLTSKYRDKYLCVSVFNETTSEVLLLPHWTNSLYLSLMRPVLLLPRWTRPTNHAVPFKL